MIHIAKLSENQDTPADSFVEILIICAKYKLNVVIAQCVPKLAQYSCADIRRFYSGELPLSIMALVLDMKLRYVQESFSEQNQKKCYNCYYIHHVPRQDFICPGCGVFNCATKIDVDNDLFEKFKIS